MFKHFKRTKSSNGSDGSKRAKPNDVSNSNHARYAARAGAAVTDTEVDDLIRTITSHLGNADILRRLKNDDPHLTRLHLGKRPESKGECSDEYCLEACSIGWLGYFIGESTRLEMLRLNDLRSRTSWHDLLYDHGSGVGQDKLLAFFNGLSRNRSVRHLKITVLPGGAAFQALTKFLAESKNLIKIVVSPYWGTLDISGLEVLQMSRALRSCTSLKSFIFKLNERDEHVVEIVNSLSEKSQLEEVGFPGCLDRREYGALADLLALEGSQLQSLNVEDCDMDMEDLEYLLNAVASNEKLQKLNMGYWHSMDVDDLDDDDPTTLPVPHAWGSIERPLLKAFVSNLVELNIKRSCGSMDDEGAIAFSYALAGNRKLKVLKADWQLLTSRGWNAVSKLLCNTTSPEATFASNHSLQNLGFGVEASNLTAVDSMFPNELVYLLALNRNEDKDRVASTKILKNHDDFDMQVFFGWEFKMLPIVVQWLARAAVPLFFNPPINPDIQRRKLSMLYQFVRGAPKLFVELRLRGELDEIQARRENIRIEQERMRQELEWLEERERAIHNNLRGE